MWTYYETRSAGAIVTGTSSNSDNGYTGSTSTNSLGSTVNETRTTRASTFQRSLMENSIQLLLERSTIQSSTETGVNTAGSSSSRDTTESFNGYLSTTSSRSVNRTTLAVTVSVDTTASSTLKSIASSFITSTFLGSTRYSYSSDSFTFTQSNETRATTSFTNSTAGTSSSTTSSSRQTQSSTNIDSVELCYEYTTTSTTGTETQTVTTTASRTFSTPTETSFSTSTSFTTDTTTTSASVTTTGSASVSGTVLTSTTQTGTHSYVTYATTWVSTSDAPFIKDTILEPVSTDWPWMITTTGEVTVAGVSFTKTTISATFQSSAVGSTTNSTYPLTAPAVSKSYTVPQANTSSGTITVQSTTLSSTYSVGVGVNDQSAPFSSTTLATISYTTSSSTTKTVSYHTFSVRSFTVFQPTVASGFTSSGASSLTTTTTNGTLGTTLTYTFPVTDNLFVTGSRSSSSIISTSRSTSSSQSVEGGTLVLNSRLYTSTQATVNPADTMLYGAATIGRGFQVSPFGRGQPVGTNLQISQTSSSLSGPATSDSVTYTTTAKATLYSGWPNVQVPSTNVSVSAASAGNVPTTLSNTRTVSTVGGIGWASTQSTTLSASIGAHRVTSQDSTGGTTAFDTSWNSTDSTSVLNPGEALVTESRPVASSYASSTTNTYAPFLNFPAFPST